MHHKKQQYPWLKIGISFLSLFSVFALIWAAFWWSGYKQSLAITQVKFGKTTVLNSHIYEATLGEMLGNNPGDIRLNDISELMESHPYVKAARVSHQYPGVIQIEILERQPIALLNTNPMVLLDAEAIVLPDVDNLGNYNLPILTNFNPEPELYPPGKEALSVKVKECIDWLSKIQIGYESLYNNLSEMKMTSENEMELILTDRPTQIYLGQDKVWSRIQILKQFEKELGDRKIS
ncbi:MAG: cell division protein FtsQ/DivIB, partial [Fidelibacterota bacterium]